MVTIVSEVWIDSSIQRVFDAARSIEVHLEAEREKKERVIGEISSGLLVMGDTITFEAVHLGVRQRLTSKIVEMNIPHSFCDKMQRGAFRFLEHWHEFQASSRGTIMRDKLIFAAPFGVFGRIAEMFVLRRYMTRFIQRHQQELKRIIETKKD